MDRKRTHVVGELHFAAPFLWGMAGIILAVLLMMGHTQVGAKTYLLQEDASSPNAIMSLVVSDQEGISLHASVTGLLTDLVSIKEGAFASLEIPGEGVTAQVGMPRLPVVRRLVELPFGASIAVEVSSAQMQERRIEDLSLDGQIVPVQPPVPKIPGARERVPFVMDEDRYAIDAFWPPELVTVREIGIFRQVRLALVELFPVRYNPQRNLVRLCSSADFEISLQGTDDTWTEAHHQRYTNSFSARPNIPRFIASDFQPDPVEGWSTTPVGYLIVVDDALYESVLPLADWKRQQGFRVTLATTSQTGLDKMQIKNYIRNAYETWDIPPTFLLLVGDMGQIPTFQVGGITTDLYFSTMSEGDYFPDIQMGRLAVVDSLELAAVVEKIVSYEKGLWDVQDGWTRRGYFMASNDSWYHGVAEGTHDYSMRLARAHGMICDSLYAYYGTGTPISVALNDGRSLALYSGHGSFYSWAGPYFTNADVNALQNGQMYPLVCSHACNTGGYHQEICFGETWLRAEGKGAAAFWGSTVSSYWEEDDILQRSMFDALFDSSITWLSGMMDQAKLEMYLYYGGGGLSESYYKQYNLLGDPSMHLWTRPPKTLVANHLDNLPLGAASFVVNVLEPQVYQPTGQHAIESTVLVPVDDALAAMNMGAELLGTAATRQGMVSVRLDPVPTKDGPMEIGISKAGYRPYLGFAQVRAHGPYLLYCHHLLSDSLTGNGDGQANPGETVELEVAIKNVGSDEAQQVTAVLAAEDSLVQLEIASAGFGNIMSADSSIGLPAYRFHVSEDCSTGHIVDFTLKIMDKRGRQWSSNIQIEVVNPVVLYHAHVVQDDSPGGNDNGVAEAGETVQVLVTLRNVGIAEARGVTATITCADPDIQILSESSEFGHLTPGSQTSGSPPYQITVSDGIPELSFCPLVLDITAEGDYINRDTLVFMAGVPGFSDDMESGIEGWTHQAVGDGYEDHWHLSGEKSYRGSHSWKYGDMGNGTYFHYENGALVSPAVLLARHSALTFWHWMEAEVYNITRAWDGAVVEVSLDGGSSWEQLTPVGGYPFTIWDNAPSAGSPFAARTPCFSGSHDWQQEQFDLSAYSGLVSFRFRFGSDQYTEREGWYIDDIKIDGSGTLSGPISDLQILFSERQIQLFWACGQDGTLLEYEIYRARQPTEVIRPENLVAVVSEPWYMEESRELGKSGEHIFYAVVTVDVLGRRSRQSPVIGRWLRPLKSQPAER